MELKKVVQIPNDKVGMVTLRPVGDSITIENAWMGTITIKAEDFDSIADDLRNIARAIDEDLEDCIKEQEDETEEETYRRICDY
jgi:hypothetical protein